MKTATFFLWLERFVHSILAVLLLMVLFLLTPDVWRRVSPPPAPSYGLEIEPAADSAVEAALDRRQILEGFTPVSGHSVLRASLLDIPRGAYDEPGLTVNTLYFDPETREERWLIEGDPTASPWTLTRQDLARSAVRSPCGRGGPIAGTLWMLKPRETIASPEATPALALSKPDGRDLRIVLEPIDQLHDAHLIDDRQAIVTWSGEEGAQWALLDLEAGQVVDRGVVGGARRP